MYKESVEREENTWRYAMWLYCIMIEVSTFFYVDNLLVDNLCVYILLSTISKVDICICRHLDTSLKLESFDKPPVHSDSSILIIFSRVLKIIVIFKK